MQKTKKKTATKNAKCFKETEQQQKLHKVCIVFEKTKLQLSKEQMMAIPHK